MACEGAAQDERVRLLRGLGAASLSQACCRVRAPDRIAASHNALPVLVLDPSTLGLYHMLLHYRLTAVHKVRAAHTWVQMPAALSPCAARTLPCHETLCFSHFQMILIYKNKIYWPMRDDPAGEDVPTPSAPFVSLRVSRTTASCALQDVANRGKRVSILPKCCSCSAAARSSTASRSRLAR
jgi:hypothetical protein